ncbi:tyrosine-type recombinase/integrase [Hydrogenophaga atypica]|uniref:Tyrosine-type recombinase/integrase n=1 Tax=Hydrogenophaga atypica TaxID=249409 RepID=A0ABW2QN93_9BURK
MAKSIERLTALQVAKQAKPGYHPDGGGLYLCVKPSGVKSWIFRYRFAGKEREMGLGSLSTYGLADARERAVEQRKLLADGVDPLAAKQAREQERRRALANKLTFDAAAARYIASQRAGWKNEKHAEQWTNTLTTYASPVIGELPVDAIDTALVVRVLEPIWTTKTETASRVRGRIEKVLDWAKVQGFRAGENPAVWRGHLDKLLSAPQKTKKVKHHPALPWREVGQFMQDLRKMPGLGALALEIIILTNCRTSELIESSWSEFDLDLALWTIPAERMKASKEHIIPLSEPTIAALRKARAESPAGALVFPSERRKKGQEQPLSNMACLALLKRMGRSDLTVHGFRSSFRDWAGEATSHPREVIEHAMSHQLEDKAEAAYQRGTLLERRKLLMNDWAAYCSRPASSGEVVDIRSKAA